MKSLARALTGLLLALSLSQAGAQSRPRVHEAIDHGWRFQKGDPSDAREASFSYDSINSWILPTGNAFMRDSSRRFARPPEGPRDTPAYARPEFDDSQWTRVDLPHDWAIAGPFITNGAPGGSGGMGRLPSPGVGWYRRKLDIPATDAGRSIFLDVDGAMSYASVW